MVDTSPFVTAVELYRNVGWGGTLPLPHRAKAPVPVGFTGYRGAMPTAAQVEAWSNDANSGNIALRLPTDMIGVDVDNYDNKTGGDTLAGLVAAHGPLPPTVLSTSRGDGISGIRLYRVPNGTALVTKLEGGIEFVQRHHRYVVCWPSIHPDTGQGYQWIDEASGEILDGPPVPEDIPQLPWEWIEALATTLSESAEGATSAQVIEFCELHVDDLKPERLKGVLSRARALDAANTSHHDILIEVACWAAREASAGAYPAQVAFDAINAWWRESMTTHTRTPGPREFSGAIAWAVGQTKLPKEAARIAELRTNLEWVEVLPAPTVETHIVRDDIVEANVVDTSDGWPIASPVEIRDVLNGSYERPLPTVLRRSDDMGLFYLGRVNSLAGEPGGGKTWLALAAVVETINSGKWAMFIDFEDRLDSAVRRLVQLGGDLDAIAERFIYVSPTFGIKGGGLPTNVVEAVQAGVDLVVIDSMGEALAHSQLNQDVDGEVSGWMATVARRLADRGASVVLLDHVTKSSDDRGRWAIGSHRKLAAIDGVAYMANTLISAAVGTTGHITLKCSKDRMGNYPHGVQAADIRLFDDDGGMRIEINPPAGTTTESGGEKLLTYYMEKLSRFLEGMSAGMSQRSILGSIEGKKQHITTALRQLVEHGFVEVEEGDRRSVIHRSVKPFREDDLIGNDTSSDRVPSASPPRPGRGAMHQPGSDSVRPPPYGGRTENPDGLGVDESLDFEPVRPPNRGRTETDDPDEYQRYFG